MSATQYFIENADEIDLYWINYITFSINQTMMYLFTLVYTANAHSFLP